MLLTPIPESPEHLRVIRCQHAAEDRSRDLAEVQCEHRGVTLFLNTLAVAADAETVAAVLQYKNIRPAPPDLTDLLQIDWTAEQ